MQGSDRIEQMIRVRPLLVLGGLLVSGLAVASIIGLPSVLCTGVAAGCFGMSFLCRGVTVPLILAGFVLVGAGRAVPPREWVPLPEGPMLWDLESLGPPSLSGRQTFVARAAWTAGPHASEEPLPKWVGAARVEGIGGGSAWGLKWRGRRAIVRGKQAARVSHGVVPLLFLDDVFFRSDREHGDFSEVPESLGPRFRGGLVWFAELGSRFLDTWRRSLRRTIGLEAPGELNGLFVALVLGDRKGLGDAQREAFARTGTSHLLAISGLHIGLLAALVFGLSRGLFRRVMWVLSAERSEAGWGDVLPAVGGLSAAGAYVLLAGSPISGLRALAMLSLFVLARRIGRQTSSWNILGGAAGLVVFCAPPAVAELGLHLSVASVAGLLCVPRRALRTAPWAQRGLSWLRAASLASAATLFATAPLCAMVWGRVALAGLWANVPLIALLGIGTVPALLMGCLVGGLVPEIAGPFFLVASSSSSLGLRLIEALAQPDRSPMLYWQPSVAEVVGCYTGFILFGWAVTATLAKLRARGGGQSDAEGAPCSVSAIS